VVRAGAEARGGPTVRNSVRQESTVVSSIEFVLAYSQHELGDNWIEIETSNDGINYTTVVVTDHDVPNVKTKNICDVYEAHFIVESNGDGVWFVNQVAPECNNPLPNSQLLNSLPYSDITHIRVGYYVMPNSSGPSGSKLAYSKLFILGEN
jgi:hypothetical protein